MSDIGWTADTGLAGPTTSMRAIWPAAGAGAGAMSDVGCTADTGRAEPTTSILAIWPAAGAGAGPNDAVGFVGPTTSVCAGWPLGEVLLLFSAEPAHGQQKTSAWHAMKQRCSIGPLTKHQAAKS